MMNGLQEFRKQIFSSNSETQRILESFLYDDLVDECLILRSRWLCPRQMSHAVVTVLELCSRKAAHKDQSSS